MVGAVQHRKVFKGLVRRGRSQTLNTGNNTLGLMVFVVTGHHTHGLTLAQVTPQGFGEQLRVGANDVVGGLEYGRGGTVVLLQRDDLELGVVDRQFL